MSLTPTPADKFTFGLWTVGNRGRDPFGDFVRPPLDPVQAVHRLGAIGAWGVNFHDNDLVPIDATPAERDRIVRDFRGALTATGVTVPMATTNLFTEPVFKDGAFTAHDARVRRYAVQKTMRAMDLGVELGARTFVFWGGREGAEVDAGKDPIEAIKRFRDAIDFLCAYARDQRYDLRFALEAKPNEPRGDIYFPTTAAYLGFISTLAHPGMVGVNPEFAHEQMAGLNVFHAVAQALEAGKLFHIDLNDQKPGRFDQDLRFGSESIKPLFFLVKLLEEQGYEGPRHFDAHAYRTEDEDGVWDFARGCMRTYLILKEKARAFAAHAGIQSLLAEIRGSGGELGPYSYEAAAALKAEAFDRHALAARRLAYERLDQLVIDLLLGAALMAPDGALYLGLDSSTQSLSAVVLEASGGRHRVVCELSLPFDQALPHYGTRHGVLPNADPAVAQSSPVMWVEALDLLFAQLAEQRLDLHRLAAVSGSAQQHGSVYLNDAAARGLETLDPGRALPPQVVPLLSRPIAPIWMDSSTQHECREIEAAVGGASMLAQHTGSRAFERFTGPQIRRFAAREPAAYAATDRIHLVSSFLASVLVGGHAPIDPGDGSGMNLLDLAALDWWAPAVAATAADLRGKLPTLAPSSAIAGRLSRYWRTRYRLPGAKVTVWSGDNPCSLIGLGLVREGQVGISLGTSDTIFGPMRAPRVDAGGTGHVFGAPTGEFMGITVFSNGSLARERVRDHYGLTWEGFSRALETTPAGNGGALMLPWFVPEITPAVPAARVCRQRLDAADAAGNVRAVVEAQMMALSRHSRWMDVAVDVIHVTGGAAVNREVRQVLADVFSAEVRRIEVGNAAALGAALRALHADRLDDGVAISWDGLVAELEQPPPDITRPNLAHRELYLAQRLRYAEFEQAEYARAGGETRSAHS